MLNGGMSVVTTLLAPITQRSPIVTPLVTTTFAPHQTLSPMVVGPLEVKPCQVIGCVGVVEAVVAVGDEAAVGEHAVLADLDQLDRRDLHAEVEEACRRRCGSGPSRVSQTFGSSSTCSPSVRRPSANISRISPVDRPAGESSGALRTRSGSEPGSSGSELRSYQRHFCAHSLRSSEPRAGSMQGHVTPRAALQFARGRASLVESDPMQEAFVLRLTPLFAVLFALFSPLLPAPPCRIPCSPARRCGRSRPPTT